LPTGDFSTGTAQAAPFRYRLTRALVRLWFSVSFRKIRVLDPDTLPESGAALLLVSHPASFLDALLLCAALKREVRCFLEPRLLRGPLRALLGGLLGMVPYPPATEGAQEAVERACDALSKGQAVLIFAEDHAAGPGETPRFSPTPAMIALRAEARNSGLLGLELFPIHLFLPVAQLYASELLIHLGSPLVPKEYLARGGNMTEQARALAAATEEACRQNVFRLHADDVRQFLADLEEIFRADLQESWAARPNWKQKIAGFELSRFIAEWVEQLNGLHPGQLVALRDLVETYREASRRCSLARLEVNQSGDWITTAWRRLAGWAESAMGLPIAFYGFVNHLLACLILFRSGLMSKEEGTGEGTRWVIRALVVIGGYAVQILLCDHWFGRTVAGYYALTLPLSGLYLWRYLWLLNNRSRPLLLDLRVRREAAKLLRMRKGLIQEVNSARDVYAERLGLAH
jgi:1-acyl-sn-glycerol-3-phosphate acyltransferase